MIRTRKTILAVALVALGIFASGCGDDTDTTDNNPQQSEEQATQSTGSTAAAGQLALAADPGGALKFDKTELNADAGDVSIKFTNDSSTPHDVTVEAEGDKDLGATDQITKSTATLDLKDVKAGTYTFYCSVPGHEDAGMKGTLTVK